MPHNALAQAVVHVFGWAHHAFLILLLQHLFVAFPGAIVALL